MDIIRPEAAIGKPFVVYIDGKRRQIGTIERAVLRNGSLMFSAKLDLAGSEAEDAIPLPEENYPS